MPIPRSDVLLDILKRQRKMTNTPDLDMECSAPDSGYEQQSVKLHTDMFATSVLRQPSMNTNHDRLTESGRIAKPRFRGKRKRLFVGSPRDMKGYQAGRMVKKLSLLDSKSHHVGGPIAEVFARLAGRSKPIVWDFKLLQHISSIIFDEGNDETSSDIDSQTEKDEDWHMDMTDEAGIGEESEVIIDSTAGEPGSAYDDEEEEFAGFSDGIAPADEDEHESRIHNDQEQAVADALDASPSDEDSEETLDFEYQGV